MRAQWGIEKTTGTIHKEQELARRNPACLFFKFQTLPQKKIGYMEVYSRASGVFWMHHGIYSKAIEKILLNPVSNSTIGNKEHWAYWRNANMPYCGLRIFWVKRLWKLSGIWSWLDLMKSWETMRGASLWDECPGRCPSHISWVPWVWGVSNYMIFLSLAFLGCLKDMSI